MMKEDDKYFLKIPIIGPKGERTETLIGGVDPERLSIDTLQLLTKSGKVGKGIRKGYTPIYGSETIAKKNSTSDILGSIIQEIMEECRLVLEASGDIGKEAFKQLSDLDLISLINTLLNQDMSKAEEALKSLLYGLMSFVSNLTSTIVQASETEEKLSRMALQLARMKESTGAIQQVQEELFLNWAMSATEIIRLATEFENLNLRATTVKTELNQARIEANVYLKNIAEDKKILEGDDSHEGFLICAFNARMQSNLDSEDLQNSFNQVKDILHKWDNIQNKVKEAWCQIFSSIKTEFLEMSGKATSLAIEMQSNQNKMTLMRSQFSRSRIKPYQEEAGAIISQVEFEKAEAIYQNPQMTPNMLKRNLEAQITGVLGLLEEPKIDAEFVDLLERVKNEIAKIEEALQSPPEIPIDAEVPEEAEKAKPQELFEKSVTISKPRPKFNRTKAQEIYDRERVQEIYEMMIAMAYSFTCVPALNRHTGINPLFERLEIIGLISPEEIDLYREAVNKIAKSSTYWETISKNMSKEIIKERWEKSNCHWISFWFGGKRWAMKLTKKTESLAKEYMAKYSITLEDMKKANQERIKRVQEAREQYATS